MENFHDGYWCNLDYELKNDFRSVNTTWFERKLIAYVFYKFYKDKSVKLDTLNEFKKTANLSDDIYEILKNNISSCWPLISTYKHDCYTWEYMRAYILNFEDYSTRKNSESLIPEGISFLIQNLLSIRESNSIACFGSGASTVFEKLATVLPNANYEIYEDEPRRRLLLPIFRDVLGDNVKISSRSFEIGISEKQYNKICLTYALGEKSSALHESCSDYVKNYILQHKYLYKAPLDWVMTSILIDKLARKGKMASLMTFNKLSSRSEIDVSIRKELIKSGKVEAVIALPENLLIDTAVPVALIIFSNNNKSIKFIDASDKSSSGYGFLYMKSKSNALTNFDIKKIVDLYKTENPKSKSVKITEVDDMYRLDPKCYIKNNVDIPYPRQFRDVINNTKRRDKLTKSYLKEGFSQEKTDYRFVSSNDIQDGVISGEPQYINENSKELQDMKKYLVGPGAVILTKYGSTLKVAIVDENEKFVLPNGNLYALELKKEIIDPYFLQAFLDSPKGQKSYEVATTTGLQTSIGISDLEDMIISCPPLEQQKEIAERYKKKLKELSDLKREEENKRKELTDVFNLK